MKRKICFLIVTILLLASNLNAAQYNLSICAIFKNEAPYFKEWIEFHKLQGVEHFFLYNNNSDDDYLTVLQPYINSGELTLKQWSYEFNSNESGVWTYIQNGAYTDCIQKYGTMTNWLAVIDLDEFLFCPSGQDLPSFLIDYEEYGGVCVNWRMFGTSHLETIPSNLLMIEALIHCSSPKLPRNRCVKSIVHPRYVNIEKSKSAHYFTFIDNYFSITADGEKVSSIRSESWSKDKIRINHYWTRTKKYFRENKIPFRHKRKEIHTEKTMQRKIKSYNDCIDTAILQFVPALREILGYDQ